MRWLHEGVVEDIVAVYRVARELCVDLYAGREGHAALHIDGHENVDIIMTKRSAYHNGCYDRKGNEPAGIRQLLGEQHSVTDTVNTNLEGRRVAAPRAAIPS